MSPDAAAITAMVSAEGEGVDLTAPLAVGEAVESWLAGLEQVSLCMQHALAPYNLLHS